MVLQRRLVPIRLGMLPESLGAGPRKQSGLKQVTENSRPDPLEQTGWDRLPESWGQMKKLAKQRCSMNLRQVLTS